MALCQRCLGEMAHADGELLMCVDGDLSASRQQPVRVPYLAGLLLYGLWWSWPTRWPPEASCAPKGHGNRTSVLLVQELLSKMNAKLKLV